MPLVLRVEIDLSPTAAALIERLLGAIAAVRPEQSSIDSTCEATTGAAPMSETMPAAAPSPAIDLAPQSHHLAQTEKMPGADAGQAEIPTLPKIRQKHGRVHGDWISEERDAVLKREYPTDRARKAILAEVNALPGPPVSLVTMAFRARVSLGLQRAAPAETPLAPEPASPAESAPVESHTLHHAAPAAPSPAPMIAQPSPPAARQPPPLPPRPAGLQRVIDTIRAERDAPTVQTPLAPVRADYNTIYKWAGERGLASVRDGMDIAIVNRKRAALGLAPFELLGRDRAAGRAA